MDVPQTRVMFFSVRLKYNLGCSCRMMLESWKARSLPWWSPTAQPRQRCLHAQQADVEQLLTWFKMGATDVLLSSLLDRTAVWRTAKTVRQELRNQTGVGREVDLNLSKWNFKLTHHCYHLLTAGLESTLLVAGEDPLLSGQTSAWFQFSTHSVLSYIVHINQRPIAVYSLVCAADEAKHAARRKSSGSMLQVFSSNTAKTQRLSCSPSNPECTVSFVPDQETTQLSRGCGK